VHAGGAGVVVDGGAGATVVGGFVAGAGCVAGGWVAGGWVAGGGCVAGVWLTATADVAGAVEGADAGTGDVGMPVNRGAPASVVGTATVGTTTPTGALSDVVCAVVVHAGGCEASALTPRRNVVALRPSASRRPPDAAWRRRARGGGRGMDMGRNP
jgi:hypothetical protein